jgi:4-amino-4-deoxy-L-arabinose transferase-like glycosyltransferase
MYNQSNIYLWGLLAGSIIVYLLGLSISIMDIDAAQYASIALEMVHKNSFLTVTNRNVDYLDKPPLIFWLSALSFKLFGVSTIAYKLPSLLFSLLTFWSTYKLARLFYTKDIALLSVIITASCQAFFMINQDCRTDTVLAGAMMFALYQLAYYVNTKKTGYFIGAFVGLALAMLAKGPIGLVLPIAIVGIDLLFKRQWSTIFSFQWFWGLIIIGVILIPMCIGLYQQFGSKGLQFYFWDQSFGRLTGENSFVKNLTASDYVNDPFFFYHTFMWLFAPWSLLFVFALFYKIKDFVKQKATLLPSQEMISWAGFILGFTMMSMSMYKLPHYIVMILPLAAICTAEFLFTRFKDSIEKWMIPIHAVLMFLLWLISFYLVGFSFSSDNIFSLFLAFTLFLVTVIVFVKTKQVTRIICVLALTIIFGNFLLNYHVYPRLLQYQSGTTIGRYIYQQHIDQRQIYNFTHPDHSLDFYAQETIRVCGWNEKEMKEALKPENYLIVDSTQWLKLDTLGVHYERLLVADSYKVSLLTPDFLDPRTRPQVLEHRAFIRIQ